MTQSSLRFRTFRRLLCAGGLCAAGLVATHCLAAGPDAKDLLERAKRADAAGDTVLARALLDPLLQEGQGRNAAATNVPAMRAEAYLMRARLFLAEHAPKSALLDAQRAVQVDPTNGQALAMLARLYRSGEAGTVAPSSAAGLPGGVAGAVTCVGVV